MSHCWTARPRKSWGKVYEEFQALGVKFCLGDSYLDTLTDYDVVFRSPGMYYHNEKLQEARKKGVVITSEMEAFFSHSAPARSTL